MAAQLNRPAVRIAACCIGMVGATLLLAAARANFSPTASAAASFVWFVVFMGLFLAALLPAVPPRYISNPTFQVFDIALGSLSVGALILILASLLLAVLATDGQAPSPPAFIAAAVIAGLGAGALNELARRWFPNAWTPAAVTSRRLASEAVHEATAGNLTIRPTRATRGFIAVFMGGLTLVAVIGAHDTPAANIAFAIFALACIAWIFWLSAGCDDDKVWFAWRSVERRTLRTFELASRPGMAVDYGGIRLFDSNGLLALTVPSMFFADGDVQRLIEVLALPVRPAEG